MGPFPSAIQIATAVREARIERFEAALGELVADYVERGMAREDVISALEMRLYGMRGEEER